MQHCSARSVVRMAAAVLALTVVFVLGALRSSAAQLEDVGGISLLSFDKSQIVSIGNQTAGKCSWYALRSRPVPGAGCGRTVRSGRRRDTRTIPATCPAV